MGASQVMLLLGSSLPSIAAFTLRGVAPALALRPVRPAAPQMLLGEELATFTYGELPTYLLAAEQIRKSLKSEGDELLDEFVSLFPIIFVVTLFGAFAFQYVKKQVTELELDVSLPELPDDSGLLLLYAFWASPALIIGSVFAKDAGVPVPSPEAVLSPVTGTISLGAGLLAKTSMDAWNLVAPVIGLGDAALKY